MVIPTGLGVVHRQKGLAESGTTPNRNDFNSRENGCVPPNLASPVAAELLHAVELTICPDHLDKLAQSLWTLLAEGEINEGEATQLSDAIERRRRPRTALTARASRFRPRQRPCSPDREKSRHRRRLLGTSMPLPDTIRPLYTLGQLAVLCIVSGEIKHHGVCDLYIDKIAALAGVCRTTVQNAFHEASRLGHIRITRRRVSGGKNLTNLVEITSAEWLAWLKRGPSAHRPIGSKTPILVSPTKNRESHKGDDLRFRRAQDGFSRGASGERWRPPSAAGGAL